MNKYVTQAKHALSSALIVIVLMQVVTGLIVPFAGLIFTALVLVTVGAVVYYRFKKL